MRPILIGFGVVWSASLVLVASLFLATCFCEWRAKVLAQPISPVRRSPTARVLTLDSRLLVPWPGLEASKRRLGVDEAVSRAAEDDRPPEPRRDGFEDPEAPPSGSAHQAA